MTEDSRSGTEPGESEALFALFGLSTSALGGRTAIVCQSRTLSPISNRTCTTTRPQILEPSRLEYPQQSPRDPPSLATSCPDCATVAARHPRKCFETEWRPLHSVSRCGCEVP